MLGTRQPATRIDSKMQERRRPGLAYATLRWVAACFLVASCAPGDARPAADRAPVAAAGLRGTPLAQPLEKPRFVLQDATGKPFDFVRETQGKVALLFFGYTHCPDVCPLHMANIAAVLKKLSWSERQGVRVVFVTTDPERDTPARLAAWLGDFDPSFVGLHGPLDDVNAIQISLGLAPASREGPTRDGYLVGHAAQVIAFGRDDVARIVYPFGTRQEDWAHDLPRLIAGVAVNAAAAHAHETPDTSLGAGGGLAIAPAVIVTGASGAALYLALHNTLDTPDTLRGVSIIGGPPVELHRTIVRGGRAVMEPAPWLEIPARSRLEMAPGGIHGPSSRDTVPPCRWTSSAAAVSSSPERSWCTRSWIRCSRCRGRR
jgi:protein SCO1